MLVFISHSASLEDWPNGTCPLSPEAAGERSGAVGIALGVERDRDAVRTVLQLRQLEEDVSCGLTLTRSTGQTARARWACDLHVVREAFGGADEERLRQLERCLTADEAIRVTPLHRRPVALLVGHDRVLDRGERGAPRAVRQDEPALPGRQARLVDRVEEVQERHVRIAG